MRGTFDHATRTYVVSAEEQAKLDRKQRAAEAGTAAWMDANPMVFVEFGCVDEDGAAGPVGEDWGSWNFYAEFGRVPLSREQASELLRGHECPCGCRQQGQVTSFSLYRPGAGDDEPPLVSWDAWEGDT